MYLVSDLKSNGYTYDTIEIGSLGHYTTSPKIHDFKPDVLKLIHNLAKIRISSSYAIYIYNIYIYIYIYTQQGIALNGIPTKHCTLLDKHCNKSTIYMYIVYIVFIFGLAKPSGGIFSQALWSYIYIYPQGYVESWAFHPCQVYRNMENVMTTVQLLKHT